MKKVMLVEDEDFILQGIKYIIDWEALSMEIAATAHNGKEALEIFQENPTDIVVTDVEMPRMNGLELLREIRKLNSRTRGIILSGYDEFEYARTALRLDVEEYILKPINEDQLRDALIRAGKHLDELDRKKAGNMEDKIGWIRFLKGKLAREEEAKFYQMLPEIEEGEKVYAAIMKIDTDTIENTGGMMNILAELQKLGQKLKPIYLAPDTLFLLMYMPQEAQDQEILDCYGSCINEAHIQDRKSQDVVIDETMLRKMILKKDKEGALNYIEDLFINNLESEVNVEVLYQMSLKIAMLLQDIKMEYKLAQSTNLRDLSEIIEKIYQADDLLGLKAIFISEIVEIINYLHTEDSQYTPVVKQIMAEVQKNYKEDMNLKTLSYKYHMNASYLGQIFQKEAGCSFAQYLSNTKNGIAKDLILNTNMKINDIAKEVGYPDTSYFYRKFKQCYGVSPASLRTMKKY